MPELPNKKVGIVACSGEELPEGTVTRLAALKVLEELRPADTVTICLPLFLAGGEGDRAFARFYPTIAVDGCEKLCAARATEMHSGKPAASLVVTDITTRDHLARPGGLRFLDEAGRQAVESTAAEITLKVDELLDKYWSRREGKPIENAVTSADTGEIDEAVCACASGIPMQSVDIDDQKVELVALPLIFEQFKNSGRPAESDFARELLEAVRIYNSIPEGAEGDYEQAVLKAYDDYLSQKEPDR